MIAEQSPTVWETREPALQENPVNILWGVSFRFCSFDDPCFNSFHRKSVHVTGSDGKLIFLLLKSMPSEYRARIQPTVQACYPRDFIPCERGKVTLKAQHFCFWNQYSEFVGAVPLMAMNTFSFCIGDRSSSRGSSKLPRQVHSTE